jgi:hypothetical protein
MIPDKVPAHISCRPVLDSFYYAIVRSEVEIDRHRVAVFYQAKGRCVFIDSVINIAANIEIAQNRAIV